MDIFTDSLLATPLALVAAAVLIILGVVGTSLLTKIHAEHSKRTTCRLCGKALHRTGGFSVMYLGPGFCPSCVVDILRRN